MPMSALPPISSASPPGADLPGKDAPARLLSTRSGSLPRWWKYSANIAQRTHLSRSSGERHEVATGGEAQRLASHLQTNSRPGL